MRGGRMRKASTFVLSVGLTTLLIVVFLAIGGFGLAVAAPSYDPGGGGHTATNTNGGGNASNTNSATSTTTSGSTTLTTRVASNTARYCVEHFVDGRLVNTMYLPENNALIQELFVQNPITSGNELWRFCASAGGETTTTSTTTGTTTTVAGTTTGTTTTVAGTTTTTPSSGATTTIGITVAGAAETVTTVGGQVVTIAVAPAPPVVASTIAGAQLPRTGGLPLAPSALGGLGGLLTAAGVFLRRLTRQAS